MHTAATYLVEVARFTDSIQSGLAAHSFSRRLRAAEYLADMADRLDSIIVKLDNGVATLDECDQLDRALHQFPAFAQTFHNAEAQLSPRIRLFVSAPESETMVPDEAVRKLKQASGSFRAVCATLLAGLVDKDDQ